MLISCGAPRQTEPRPYVLIASRVVAVVALAAGMLLLPPPPLSARCPPPAKPLIAQARERVMGGRAHASLFCDMCLRSACVARSLTHTCRAHAEQCVCAVLECVRPHPAGRAAELVEHTLRHTFSCIVVVDDGCRTRKKYFRCHRTGTKRTRALARA